jgi:16S rRNA (uracil1498-N3)-methyltransferase
MHWAWIEHLTAGDLLIEGPEAHHLLHVLRMKTGSRLTVFDGSGRFASAVVVDVGRRDVRIAAELVQEIGNPHFGQLTVAAAPPKGDRLRTMVEKLTEIGVHRLVLLETERSVTAPGETRVEKLRTSVIAACKQARRPQLMEILPLTELPQVLQTAVTQQLTTFVAHPGPATAHTCSAPTENSLLLIGPEGGFTDAEIHSISATSARFLTWPGTILRTETAAVVFAAMLLSAPATTGHR